METSEKLQVLERAWRNWNANLGMQNGAATGKDSLAVPHQVKRRITTRPRDSTPRYLPKRTEDKCSNIDLDVDVPSSTVHSRQKVETTQTSVSRWVGKQHLLCVSEHRE